ncbi:hypothetical protein U370_01525 [Anaplasma marginale str. Dawn]|nr:hypothetical protein U128_01560 [Anaplasma marginale str. Gypsy Plains]AGZ79566.1 hypothetical protein U370_01525 [Anaplasma marginale str. Dawn]
MLLTCCTGLDGSASSQHGGVPDGVLPPLSDAFRFGQLRI